MSKMNVPYLFRPREPQRKLIPRYYVREHAYYLSLEEKNKGRDQISIWKEAESHFVKAGLSVVHDSLLWHQLTAVYSDYPEEWVEIDY